MVYSSFVLIIVARDRDSDDCYVLVALFIFKNLFRPPNFRRHWADFRETLLHDDLCPEIVYPLQECSYMSPNKC